MILDLLSTNNYVSFNVQLAHLLGLEQSIYLSELLNINSKAVKKDKLNNNFMTVDRDYIQTRTTLSIDKQRELDTGLVNLGIISVEDNNNCVLSLHIEVITALMMSETDSIKTDVAKIVKNKSNRKTKSEAIIENLRNNIITDNQELRQAYYDWIDSVYAKQGWMSKKAVLIAQNEIDKFTNRNLDLALKILEIASISGYRDITWAINAYTKNYNVNYKIANQPVSRPDVAKINTEVVF